MQVVTQIGLQHNLRKSQDGLRRDVKRMKVCTSKLWLYNCFQLSDGDIVGSIARPLIVICNREKWVADEKDVAVSGTR